MDRLWNINDKTRATRNRFDGSVSARLVNLDEDQTVVTTTRFYGTGKFDLSRIRYYSNFMELVCYICHFC